MLKTKLLIISLLIVITGSIVAYCLIDTEPENTTWVRAYPPKKTRAVWSGILQSGTSTDPQGCIVQKRPSVVSEIKSVDQQPPPVISPRYIREGWKRIDDVLITHYAWNEKLELRWKGKTSLNKSSKNDYGCATLPSIFGYGTEIYFSQIRDYRVVDDRFSSRSNDKLLAYWSKKTGKDIKYHIDIRWTDKSIMRKMRTGIYSIYVRTK